MENRQSGLPEAEPPTKKNTELLNLYGGQLRDADKHARKAAKELNKSFAELVQYLTQDMTSDLQKLRALLVWLSRQNFLKGSESGSKDENTPGGFLNLVALKTKDVTDLFVVLCGKVGIPCVCIQGFCKYNCNYRTVPGPTINSKWAAVYVAGQWGFVHPRLAFRNLSVRQSQYRLIEQSDKSLPQSRAFEINGYILEKFFLPDPERFIYMCRPQENVWQLLGRDDWSWEKFIDAPDSRPTTPSPPRPSPPRPSSPPRSSSPPVPDIDDLDVPDTEEGYQPPCPPKNSKKDALRDCSFRDPDSRAQQVPYSPELYASYDTLFGHLFKGLDTDAQKVRALVMWTLNKGSHWHSSLYRLYKNVTDPNTLLGLLKLRIHYYYYNCIPSEQMLAVMCRKAKIPCVVVRGQKKRADLYSLGDLSTEDTKQTWNAVYLDGSWRIISVHDFHCRVHCKEMIQTDNEGRDYCKREISRTEEINEFFFLTDPEEFVHFGLPDDPQWQLLDQPVSTERFFDEPWILPAYFQTPARLSPDAKVRIQAQGRTGTKPLRVNGEISAHSPFLYKLYYKESLDTTWPEDLKMEKYVTITTVGKTARAIVFSLPVRGTYLLEWFNAADQTLLKLLVECTGDLEENIPFPGSSDIGFGPQETAQQAGLQKASRGEGMVVAREGDNVGFKFDISANRANRQFIGKFLDAKNRQHGGEKRVEVVERNNQLLVTARVPFGKDDSQQLALQISAKDENNDVKDVVKYLMTSDSTVVATAADRSPAEQAAEEVTSATDDCDVERLEVALREGRRHHLEKKSVGEVQKAQGRLMELHRKALLQAMKKEDVEGLQEAMDAAHRSAIAYYVHRQPWFQKAEDTLRLLRRRRGSSVPQTTRTDKGRGKTRTKVAGSKQ